MPTTPTSLLKTLVSGIIFGQCLLHSGLQQILQDHNASNTGTRITTIYAFALFTSTISIAFARHVITLAPRTPSTYFVPYDGNITGGLVQGICMYILKSEPGMLLVQFGAGSYHASWAIAGGLLGGLLFVLVNPRIKSLALVEPRHRPGTSKSLIKKATATSISLVVAMVACVVGWVGYSELGFGFDFNFDWIREYDLDSKAMYGGVGIGLTQLVSLLLTKGTLGVSSVYPACATIVLGLFDGRPHPGYNSLVFACGTIISGFVFRLFGGEIWIESQDGRASFVAGALLVLGARVAGGCTSGHGISGCGLLSKSSYVSVASMILGIASWKLLALSWM